MMWKSKNYYLGCYVEVGIPAWQFFLSEAPKTVFSIRIIARLACFKKEAETHECLHSAKMFSFTCYAL